MPQESALRSLPSFSKTAFSQTSPQIEYKAVRRIRPRGAKNDAHVSAAEECRPTLIKQSVFPNAKDIILINGVDPNCKTNIKFKSTDFPLPFLYSDDFGISTGPKTVPPKPQPTHKSAKAPDSSSSSTRDVHERKRPKLDSDLRVEVEITERKRPKREAERRAEALAKQGKR